MLPKTPSPEPEKEASREAHPEAKHFEGAHDDFGLTPKARDAREAKEPKEPRVRAQRIDPLLGMDLGGVKIVKLIGEGGMGRVYEALQDKPARTVAVKVIRAGITSEKTLRRFEKEAEYLGKLQHPGIAQIHIVGTYTSDFGDVPFYVMEYLANAKPITNYAHEHGLTLHAKLALFKHVCEAVSHGHDRGIVHRDLKPGNILVDAHGTPKVIDFGVARSTDSDLTLESMKTDSGQLVGTLQYMSPEQFGPDPEDLDGRADVYSLGVVFYELLSGSPPYSVKKKALHEASRVVCEQNPVPLRLATKSIPRDVSAICERCLQKSRDRRYHTAGELAADIGRFLAGQPVRAKSGGLKFPDALRPLKDNKIRAAVLLGGLALVGWWFSGRGAEKPQAQPESQPHSRPDTAALIPPPPVEQPRRPTPEPLAPALPPPPSRPEPSLQPQAAELDVTSQWTPSDLLVREGDCYTITVAGECTDKAGRTFSPDGPTPATRKTLLGAPVDTDNRTRWKYFMLAHPRQMLLATAGDAATNMAIGSGRTFIAPGDGRLAFRFNDSALGNDGTHGKLVITLVPVPAPTFLAPDGTTTIVTRITGLKYLVFESGGLRWDFRTMLSTGDDDDYPVLINGIAWWPERDVRRVTQSKLLRTRDFAWAAAPNPIEPKVEFEPRVDRPYSEVATGVSRNGSPALKFSDPGEGPSEISCRISRP